MIRHKANQRGGDPAQLFSSESGTAEDPPPWPAAAHEVVVHGVVIREDGVEGRPVEQGLLVRSAALSDQRTVAHGLRVRAPASLPITAAPVLVPDWRVSPSAANAKSNGNPASRPQT